MGSWRLAAAILAAAVWLSTCVSAQEAAPSPAASAEIEFWQSVKDSKNPAEVRAYLDRHPNGEFAALARLRLLALENAGKEQPAPAPAPKSPPSAAALKALADALAPVEMTTELTREVQQKLYDLNFRISKVDGVMSDETIVAIRRLQGLLVQSGTGKLTAAQLAVLRRMKVSTVWGAMAWGRRGESSIVFQQPDRATAERDAKAQCKRKTGKECDVGAVEMSSCIALATSQGQIGNILHSAMGVGRGPNLEKARDVAQLECRGISKTPTLCRVRQEMCADGSHRPQPPVGASPSPQGPQPTAAAAKTPSAQSTTGEKSSTGPKSSLSAKAAGRPDATQFSYTIWPSEAERGSFSSDTKHGRLACHSSMTGGARSCFWQ
jgi:Domain of unknown function (DUF4189)